MIPPCCRWRLIGLAIQLTAIAILCGTPRGGRQPEAALEGARKRFGRTKPNRERHLQHGDGRLGDQSLGAEFQSPPSHVFTDRLTHPRGEQPVEMKRREMRNAGERLEFERVIEMPIDVVDDPMESSRVLGAAFYVETSNVSGFHSIPSVVGPAM